MAAKNKTFEESMTRLEEIVRSLEGGAETLEQSLKLYEEGIALVRVCSQKLDQAETKVKQLSAEDIQMTEKDHTGE